MATFKQSIPAASTGHVYAQSLASAASSPGAGGWLLPAKARAFGIVCQTATLSAGTATYKLQSADDANGTNAADITGYTSIASHSAAKSITLAEIPASAVPAGKYLAAICTTVGGTGICSATVHLLDPSYS
jgi:hypothetical protein